MKERGNEGGREVSQEGNFSAENRYLIWSGVAASLLGEVVIRGDGGNKEPPLEVVRAPQLSVSRCKKLADSAIPALNFALRLGVASGSTGIFIAESPLVVLDP